MSSIRIMILALFFVVSNLSVSAAIGEAADGIVMNAIENIGVEDVMEYDEEGEDVNDCIDNDLDISLI